MLKKVRQGSMRIGLVIGASAAALGIAALVGCGGNSGSSSAFAGGGGVGLPLGRTSVSQVQRGRYLVTSLSCADCHAQGNDDPSSPTWLAGFVSPPNGVFQIGPFKTYAKNLTPDTMTGIGMHTDRQIFNALRYGLAPDETPDALITSTTPGQGNFPAQPHYLAPPMPWPSFRHLTDDDLWAIVAYLKHGIKPVMNSVPESQDPPDFWASSYMPDKIGPATFPPYPAGNEQFTP